MQSILSDEQRRKRTESDDEKNRRTKSDLPLRAFVFAVMFLPAVAQASDISSLSKSPQIYDGQDVTVHGSVADFHQSTGAFGGNFAMFSVCGGGCVRVYVNGSPRLADGQSVVVSGLYFAVERVNGAVYYNQIHTDVLSIHPDQPQNSPQSTRPR